MKMTQKLSRASVALLLVGSMCLSACTAVEDTASTTADGAAMDTTTADTAQEVQEDAQTRIFTDCAGRAVEIPTEITSVAVTGQLGQIVLLSLAPDLLLGIASEWDESAAEFLPEAYYNLPVLGQVYSTSGEISLEELIALSPDIVIDIGEYSDSIGEEMDALQTRTGIPFVHVSSTLATNTQMYTMLGELLNCPEDAQVLAEYCATIYDTTVALTERLGEDKVSLVYCLGEDGTNVLGAGSYHAELIDLLAENIAVLENPSSKGTGDTVSFEQLLLWDPEVILFAPDSVYDAVATSAQWNELSAIQSGQYYQVPNGPYNWLGMPPSIQRYLGMLWLSEVLYPDETETDLQEAVTEYFSLFYHCDLTDAQYLTLMEGAL